MPAIDLAPLTISEAWYIGLQLVACLELYLLLRIASLPGFAWQPGESEANGPHLTRAQ